MDQKMALEQRMIEPFEEGQIRNGVISYGTSSYGYDIRVADEFKIFTNINSAIVDPKNFDPRSMVDFRGEVCIIPPNSFALARSLEYFRIHAHHIWPTQCPFSVQWPTAPDAWHRFRRTTPRNAV